MNPERTFQAHLIGLWLGVTDAKNAAVLRELLTDVEYSRVLSKTDDMYAVDELVKILLAKTDMYRKFDGICEILREHGYERWARKLEEAQSFQEIHGAKRPKTDKSPVTGTPNPPREQLGEECNPAGESFYFKLRS